MAFHDGLAKDPKNEDEFWRLIEETFGQVEATLTDFPVETREQALQSYATSAGGFVRYRGVSEDSDSRDYFLTLGRKFVPRVKRQIKSRRLTPRFAKDWGVVMMCHGFIAAHILDDSDSLSQNRGGLKSGQTRSKRTQQKWVARQILAIMETGLTRVDADARLGSRLVEFVKGGRFPPGFEREWFASMLDDNEALRDAYGPKRLSKSDLKRLASEPNDDIY
jgi:hypothetical protein